ncbi:MAG TPA: hypothetical protein VFY84_19160 [Jiangellales bacterium]|nr:hypothetical protein [Jiangellales bacterium]
MAVRQFDGVDDVILCAVGAFPAGTGPLTVLCLWKPTAVEAGCLIRAIDLDTSGTTVGINPYSDGNIYFTVGSFGSMAYADTDGWLITGFSKAAGSAATTGHRYSFNTDTWTHPSLGNLGGSAVAPDELRIGWWSGVEFGNMRLAAIAAYSANLDNATVETLDQALADWLALDPDMLLPFTQPSTATPVTDATGNGADQTSITGTSVVTDDDPPGFNLNISVNEVTFAGAIPLQTLAAEVSGTAEVNFAGAIPMQALAAVVSATGQVEFAGAIPLQTLSVIISPPVDTEPISWIIEQGIPVWRISQA